MSARAEFAFPAAGPPLPVYTGPERRSFHPLNQLGRRLDRACTRAVDPLEIAAVLEADGVGDRAARERYGCEDVFALAEVLYKQVPFRPPPARSAPRAGRKRAWREGARGLLFALPGLTYPAVGAVLEPRAAVVGLVVSAGGAWAWSQAMAWLGYRLLGRGEPRAAGRLLRATLAMGVALVTLLAWLAGSRLGAGSGVALLAASETTYYLSAAVLLMLGRDALLAACLAPGLAAGAVYLARPDTGTGVALAAAALSAGLTLGAALWGTFGLGRGRPSEGIRLSKGDVLGAVPFVAYGGLCAALLSADALVGALRGGPVPASLGVAVAPLVLSMGLAEWQLRRYRERVAALLARATRAAAYPALARRAFAASLLRYWLGLAILSALGALVALGLGALTPAFAAELAAHLGLGAAFFAGFVLTAHGRVGQLLACLLAVTALRFAWAADLVAAPTFLGSGSASLLTSALLAAALLLAAMPVVARVGSLR